MASDVKHHRRSIRFKGYDYSQAGAYFITICTQDRACLFGEIVGGQMRLNDAGRMVMLQWNAQTDRFPIVRLDTFIAMPNHIHGILWIDSDVGAGLVPAHAPAHDFARATTRVAPTPARNPINFVGAGLVPAPIPIPATAPIPTHNFAGTPTRGAPTIGDIVGAFKSLTTVAYARGVEQSGWPGFRGKLWQRNYYEHIIRDDEELTRIRQYTLDNPAQWAMDHENPKGLGYGVKT